MDHAIWDVTFMRHITGLQPETPRTGVTLRAQLPNFTALQAVYKRIDASKQL